jgi:hypothetical protein
MFTPFCSADLSTLTTAAKRDLIAQLRDSIRTDAALKRDAKATAKVEKAAARESKKADRVAKLQAKIDALLNPVGTKAVKANKKPSGIKVFDSEEIAECNAIAAKIAAKRQTV